MGCSAVKRNVATSVYLAFAEGGTLLYVGITGAGKYRLAAHAQTSGWWPLAVTIHIRHFATRDEALAEERRLIAEGKPQFN